jgi:hypothetical protein
MEQRELPVSWHIQDAAGAKISKWCVGGPERSEDG